MIRPAASDTGGVGLMLAGAALLAVAVLAQFGVVGGRRTDAGPTLAVTAAPS